MKKVLIVDDDSKSLSLFPRLFRPHAENFDVLTATNGQEAIDIINNVDVDLVLTDLEMPMMDGYELLAYMSDNWPDTPVFVMTDSGRPETEDRVKSLGASNYFEKPINIDALVECIFEELDADSKSQIWGIGLPSFMQLLEMEKKTGTLTVKSGDNEGKLYFTKGELNAAETAEMRNKEAVYEMLMWENTVIEIENFNKIKKNEINIPLMNLLMEGLRLKDEKKDNDKPTPLTIFIDKNNMADLTCPECSHSYSAVVKRKKD